MNNKEVDPLWIEKVKACAEKFRKAIDTMGSADIVYVSFKRFPLGTCGDTSLMLGAYLSQQGCDDFAYVCGNRGRKTHAWLEKDKIIADITSDQFKEGKKIYVGPGNPFYAKYKVEFRHKWYESLCGKSIITDRLYEQYLLILRQIEKGDTHDISNNQIEHAENYVHQ